MLNVQGVTKKFGTLCAVDNVSFSVPKGRIVGLLGQNGAGKTTLMNIITGCLSQTEGSVMIGGYDVLKSPREAKRLLGYLPEFAPVYTEMTVNEYLRFVCELKEIVKSEIPSHIEYICNLTGISDIRNRLIANLSKGYRQRVGLAQALCGSPELIVLDEPTVGLDPAQMIEFRKLIEGIRQQHTVILSSHILSEVQTLCDRVLIIKQGSLVFDSENNGRATDEVQLKATIAMGEKSLLKALNQLRGLRHVEVVRNDQDGLTTVILTAGVHDAIERELFNLLSALNAPLLRLMSVENSLEEIFLRENKEDS